MRWLGLRVMALRHGLPRFAYGLALPLVVCLLLPSSLPLPLPWVEWVAYVASPAVLGLGHLLAAREVHGGKPYWALTFAWLGAASLGALAHWHALDPGTPWLSLGRYCLIVTAVLLATASLAARRPWWVAEESVGIARPAWVILAAMVTLGFLVVVGYVVSSTSFPLALAPRCKGTVVRQLLSHGERNGPIWYAWSPDSQSLLLLTDEKGKTSVWLLDVRSRTKTLVASEATFSGDRPWAADGSGFYYTKSAGEEAGVWLCSGDLKRRRLVMPGDSYGHVTCSPDGKHIAYEVRDEVWVGNVDGSGAHMVAAEGVGGKWSPDGRHLMFFTRGHKKHHAPRELWVASLDGKARPLPARGFFGDMPEWLNSTGIAASSSPPTQDWWGLRCRDRGIVEIWDVTGRRTASYAFDTPLFGVTWIGAVPAPDGRRVAVDLGAGMPTVFAPARVFILDVETGKLSAVPVPAWVFSMKWSPDGRMLAFDGTSFPLGRGGTESHHGLYLVSGL